MLCAGAAAQGRTRGLNFFVWNFAWDRLASRLYAATAMTFLMKIKYIWIWQEVGQRPGKIHMPDRWPAHLITLNCSGYKYERSPSRSQLDSTLRTCIHHPATPVYRLESQVHRTPRGRTIRELLCGLVYYLYIEPCVACVTIRRIHTAGINIYYICILDLFVPPLYIITSLSPTGCCIVKSAPRY